MKRISWIIVILLVQFAVAVGRDTTIVINGAYDKGSFYKMFYYNRYPLNDTVTFSNGVRLSVLYFQSGILEDFNQWNAISFDTSTFNKIGFKYSESGKWDALFYFLVVNHYISSDTIWDMATKFPDTLAPLDSLIDRHLDTNTGIWCFLDDVPYGFCRGYTIHALTIKNYNKIIYIKAKDNSKMKIQIFDIPIISTPCYECYPGCTCCDTKVDSIGLRWMVDSLGNGKFDIPVNTKSGEYKRFYTMSPSARDLMPLRARQCYNLKGQLLHNGITGSQGVIIVKNKQRLQPAVFIKGYR